MAKYPCPPWLKSRRALCPAYLPSGYESQPRELRVKWDTLHRLNVNRTIARKIKEGFKLLNVEERVGNGRTDIKLQSPDGRIEKIEIKGTRQVSGTQLLQSVCYHNEGDKVAVAALDETVELEDWFIHPAKTMLEEIDDFVQRFPEEASRIYNPVKELCRSCGRTDCRYNKRGGDFREAPAGLVNFLPLSKA